MLPAETETMLNTRKIYAERSQVVQTSGMFLWLVLLKSWIPKKYLWGHRT
jgi:hypothetical protein